MGKGAEAPFFRVTVEAAIDGMPFASRCEDVAMPGHCACTPLGWPPAKRKHHNPGQSLVNFM